MSDHLPSDSRKWPKEPFALLGVSTNVDRRRLRQAYVALIRKYKPEHHPNEFRLIREAFDAAQNFLEWREAVGGQIDDESDSAATEEGASPPSESAEAESRFSEEPGNHADREQDSEKSAEPREPQIDRPAQSRRNQNKRPPLKDLTTELGEVWDWACDDRDTEAYHRLSELQARHPSNEEIVLRLYWLLWTNPQLDADKTAMDWLSRGLAQGAAGPRIRQLMMRAWSRAPELAVPSSISELLEQVHNPHVRSELASARWRAAVVTDRGDIVQQDLESLRPKLQFDESTWQGLLFEAVEQSAWSTRAADLEALQGYWQELNRLDSLRPGTAAQMDQLEFTLNLTETWRTLRKTKGIPQEIADCLWANWAGPDDRARRRAEDAARLLNRDRRAAIALADRIRGIGPALLFQLRSALNRIEREWEREAADADDLASLTTSLSLILWRSKTPDYAEIRLRLLDFCLHEMVSPDEVANLLENSSDGQFAVVQAIIARLRQDLALDCVVAAHAAYCS